MGEAPPTVYSTCPFSNRHEGDGYLRVVREAASWSEAQGCEGMLIASDNSLVDPWCLAQVVIESTSRLVPLVAVQPIYMHPYAVAKMVATLGDLYGRAVALNLVAGGFRNDLLALNDPTPHDRRYDRLVEYATIIKALLAGSPSVTFKGEFYAVDRLKLVSPLPAHLLPVILSSGSSEAGVAAARQLDAVPIEYPRPAAEYAGTGGAAGASARRGLRVGILAREDEAEAWGIARARFPEERKGQITHRLAMQVSDSAWYKDLSEMAGATTATEAPSPYWLGPFENYKTMCPYLVGSHERVADELARYLAAGFSTLILDVPASEEDLVHTRRTLELACERCGR